MVAFPESLWKDAEAILGFVPSTLVSLPKLSQRVAAIPRSQFGWKGAGRSQAPSSSRGHTLRVWWPCLGFASSPIPPEGAKFPLWQGAHPGCVLKTTGWNSLKAEPETKSCQTWGKLDLIRASLLRPFSSKVPKKSQPCLCHSHSLCSRKCSFTWNPPLTIFGTQFIPVGSGAEMGEHQSKGCTAVCYD